MPKPKNDELDEEMTDEEIETEESIDQLRAAARRSKANKAEADRVKRELALVKAGVDIDSKVGKLVAQSYDGELTKEAIVAYCADIPGALSPVTQTTTPPADEQGDEGEQNDGSTGERNRLASDSQGDGQLNQGPDPYTRAREARDEAYAKGLPVAEGRARQFSEIIQAAAQGDERVMVK